MVRPKSGKTFRGKVWGTHRCTELWAVGCALEAQIASEMERQGLLQPCMYIQGWGGGVDPKGKGENCHLHRTPIQNKLSINENPEQITIQQY